jgi:acetyltransferase-like isoleucine patch superfamily enzyme
MRKNLDLSQYKSIVGYGIGQYYDYIKERIPPNIHINYLCDTRYEQIGNRYNGIEVISPSQLRALDDVFVIVFSGNHRNYQSISSMLEQMALPYLHANQIIDAVYAITGRQLKAFGGSVYSDARGNRIEFFEDIEDTVTICFHGDNNHIQIGSSVSVGKLNIICGNNVLCSIGSGTEIEAAEIHVTNGSISIGEDCLFSYQVTLRNHDTHHIFDKITGERINFAGDMTIGNHVWLGYGVTLLGNACIGDNSIVGTMAVTTGTFPREVIIAGNPARIIREHVCWSKDNTNFFDRKHINECLALEAAKYF